MTDHDILRSVIPDRGAAIQLVGNTSQLRILFFYLKLKASLLM